MNNVIHVVHAKSKNVFFTITITSPVDAIHHPCSQLESAAPICLTFVRSFRYYLLKYI